MKKVRVSPQFGLEFEPINASSELRVCLVDLDHCMEVIAVLPGKSDLKIAIVLLPIPSILDFSTGITYGTSSKEENRENMDRA